MNLKKKYKKDILAFEDEKEREDFEVTTLHLDFMEEIRKILISFSKNDDKDLAEILGVSQPHVSQLYSGDKIINLKKLNKIQKKLDFRFKLQTNFQQVVSTKTLQDAKGLKDSTPIFIKIPPKSIDITKGKKIYPSFTTSFSTLTNPQFTDNDKC